MDIKSYRVKAKITTTNKAMVVKYQIDAKTTQEAEYLVNRLIELNMDPSEKFTVDIKEVKDISDIEYNIEPKANRTINVDISATIPVKFDRVEYKDHSEQELIELAISDLQDDVSWVYDSTLRFKGHEE